MKQVETTGNGGETVSNGQVTLDDLMAMEAAHAVAMGHHDELIHDILRKVDEMHTLFTAHKPALERAGALLDPGAGVRSFLGGKRAKG